MSQIKDRQGTTVKIARSVYVNSHRTWLF